MSMYAVKNDKGEWLGWEVYQDDPEFICGGGSVWTDLDKAKFYAKANGGHLVELIEKPEPVVVSKEEAKMLERAKSREEYPAKSIHRYVYDSHNFSEWDYDREIRLMRAYVNGYTIEKPKLWNVKVPHTKDVWYYKADKVYLQTICPAADKKLRGKFTESEIEHYGLQDCERVEVTDNVN